MLDPRTWLEAAQSLPLDGQQRVRHECGQGKVMVVYHKDEGWSSYCHRCGERGFVARPRESLAERLARIKAREQVEATVTRSIVPPTPAVTDVGAWPLGAKVWLYKAGFSNEDIYQLGIYYHEKLDRVIVPIISGGKLLYWQGRAYDWTPRSDRPKYLNPLADGARNGVRFSGQLPLLTMQHGVDGRTVLATHEELRRDDTVANSAIPATQSRHAGERDTPNAEGVSQATSSGREPEVGTTCPTSTQCVALVEDYLSAYKVSRAGIDTIALLGTTLGEPVLKGLLEHRPIVYVWLDNDLGRRDNPGQEAAMIICKQLRQFGLTVRNVVSNKDPKLHSRKEIVCRLTQLF